MVNSAMLSTMDVLPDHAVTIGRCDPNQDKLVLALAATSWPEEERASRWQAISGLLRAGQAADLVLLAARRGDKLIAVLLAQVLPGRTAVVWLPQFSTPDEAEQHRLTGELHAHLALELVARGVHLVQSLESCEDRRAAALLANGGLTHAADLLYMAAIVEDLSEQNWPLSLVSEGCDPANPAAAARLTQLIDRTYVGTLDCPRIDGLRATADVIDGYQAIGQFRPGLWRIFCDQANDVGCLLMSLHPEANHAEIVYLALVPEARGRSCGLELTRYALRLAQQTGCERLVLAVDAANEPAIRMYAAAGFSQWDKKAVWIKSLR